MLGEPTAKDLPNLYVSITYLETNSNSTKVAKTFRSRESIWECRAETRKAIRMRG